MTIYALGSVHGNYDGLMRVLDYIDFDRSCDALWFSGNMVNGGQQNLEVLRFVKELGRQAVCVLGTEELRLLSIAEGLAEIQTDDRFSDVLAATDRAELLKWLYRCPFLHHQMGFTLVHAGIPPEWSLSQVRTFAIEAESSLSMGNHKIFFENVAGDTPTRWHAKHRGWNRTRFIINALTRMYYINDKGRLDFSPRNTLLPDEKEGITWYQFSNRVLAGEKVLFNSRSYAEDDSVPDAIPLYSLMDKKGVLRVVKLGIPVERAIVPTGYVVEVA